MLSLAAALIVFLTCGPARAANPSPAPADHRRQLAAGCDELLRGVSRTPYGWGWKHEELNSAPAPTRGGRAPRVVTMDVAATASAGLVLHLAGRQLGEERYVEAARQAARAVVAVQMNSGQVPATGVIRANAGGRDEPAAVPSRAATCAALGLLLTIVHESSGAEVGTPAADGPFRRAAIKASNWLAAQQTRSGGWLVAHPPGAAPGDADRLVRLDTPEYRDATITLWLAAYVLGEERLARKAEQSVEDLVVLRIADERSAGFNLWTTAYTGDGTMLSKFPELAPAIDTLASRNAMQALLAACLVGDAEATAPVLKEAAAALDKLPRENGRWRRRYDLDLNPRAAAPAPPPAEDEPPVSPLFPDDPPAAESTSVSGVDEVLRAVKRLEAAGFDAFRAETDKGLPIVYRLALAACGLGDDVIASGTPPPAESRAEDPLGRLRTIVTLAWKVRLDAPAAQSNGRTIIQEREPGR